MHALKLLTTLFKVNLQQELAYRADALINALLSVWRLVNTLMVALVWPNTQKFNTSVRDGLLDYTLLQPANSQFLVSFSRIVLWRAWDVVLAVALIVVGIRISGGGAAPLNIANFLLLTVSGVLIIYSLWIVMISFT